MTLYDEWLRSAAAFEKKKEKLDESEQRLKEAEKKRIQSWKKRVKAEADHQRFQLLVKVLLDQGRTEDRKRRWRILPIEKGSSQSSHCNPTA